MLERHFRAMGTEIELLLDAPPSTGADRALRAGEDEFVRLEHLLSRFSDDSELSRLNREGSMTVGTDLLAVTRRAVEARARTGGRFDPTILRSLVAAGYDRSFEDVPADGPDLASQTRCGGEIRIDVDASTVTLGEGVELDLGGIAKGYAVDRVADALDRAGPCLVNAGGDLAASRAPLAGCWPVGVDTADGQISLAIVAGGVATSGRDRRRWQRGGEERHHLIDPESGRPSASDLIRATVFARSASEAEIHAKALYLVGAEAAREEADRLQTPCVLVTADGRTILAGGLR